MIHTPAKLLFLPAVMTMVEAASLAAMPAGDVFDEARYTGICALGAMAGAFLSVAVFSAGIADPKGESITQQDRQKFEVYRIRRLALKFFAALVSGLTLTPALIELTGSAKTADRLMGTSCLVAVVAVTLLHSVLNIAHNWINTSFKSVLDSLARVLVDALRMMLRLPADKKDPDAAQTGSDADDGHDADSTSRPETDTQG